MTFFAPTARHHDAAEPAEGLFARMIRLWIEHHQRMLEFGIGPR